MFGLGTTALIKGGGALAKYGMARYSASKRNYGDTALAKEYAKIKREGAITQEMQNNILGRQNRTLSAQAGGVRARTQGSLINRGMEGSISGTRALAQPGIERMRELGYTSRDLAAENAQSKVDAGLQYAEGKTAYNAQTEEMKRGANRELVGDALRIGGEYALGKVAEAKAKEASDLEQTRYDQKIAASKPIENAVAEFKQSGDADMLYAKLLEQGLDGDQILLLLKQLQSGALPQGEAVAAPGIYRG